MNQLQEVPLSPQAAADDDWLFADVTESFDAAGGDHNSSDDGTLKKIPNEKSQSMAKEDEDRVHHFLMPHSSSHSQLSRGGSSSNHLSPLRGRSTCTSAARLPVIEIPPQLHPAVSLGVRRVSSCYFSLESHESMADLLSQFGDSSNSHHHNCHAADDNDASGIFSAASTWIDSSNADDVLYHDILMNVFDFLDAQSLKSFSETARRPNFEVFYYLQLQLQQALLVDDKNEPETRTDNTIRNHTIAGSASLSRLAALDMDKAQQVVNAYLQSNSTLRTMPLSHSLAYARRYLMHNGFSKVFPNNNENKENNNNNGNKALASAALFMTVVGAASLVSTVSGGDAAAIAASIDSFGSELPNVLFRVGVMGGLMGAAKQMSDTEHRAAIKEKAENMTRSMKELPSSLMRGRLQDQVSGEEKDEAEYVGSASPSNYRLPSLFEMRDRLHTTLANMAASELEQNLGSVLSNPYDHLPTKDENVNDDDNETRQEMISITVRPASDRKMPSGCVGAYARAIRHSSKQVTDLVKQARKVRFEAKSVEDQCQMSLDFLNACTSNDSLDRVKDMVQSMDVDGFFLGSDGTETCALHTAAFHGADKVVDFLCNGIVESDPRQDGGLCDVNSKDGNGWTAMHFAAGANSVAVVQVLYGHGALLQVEAHNGYSPLQWALRLSNNEVAQELTETLAKTPMEGVTWSSQPLTSLANRFFALIPTH